MNRFRQFGAGLLLATLLVMPLGVLCDQQASTHEAAHSKCPDPNVPADPEPSQKIPPLAQCCLISPADSLPATSLPISVQPGPVAERVSPSPEAPAPVEQASGLVSVSDRSSPDLQSLHCVFLI